MKIESRIKAGWWSRVQWRVLRWLGVVSVALFSGCAVVKGKAGGSTYMGWAFGERASSTLAGLRVSEDQAAEGTVVREVGVEQAGSDSETRLTEMMGALVAQVLGVVQVRAAGGAGGVSVGGFAPSMTQGGAGAGGVAEAARSVVTGEGAPVVVVLGSRGTCGYCRRFWAGVDAGALSSDLCGATVVDADLGADREAYGRYRPQGAFVYPLVRVFASDGAEAGQFVARGMGQVELLEKLRGLLPECRLEE